MTKKSSRYDQLLNFGDLDFTSFTNLKLEDITCWEELVMWLDISSMTLDIKLMKFLIIMSFWHNNILEALCSGFRDYDAISVFDFPEEAVELVYKLISPKTLNGNKLMNVLDEYYIAVYGDKVKYDPNISLLVESKEKIYKHRGKLFDAIDNKCNLALLKFYNKWRRELQYNDYPFVTYLKFKTFQKAKSDNMFAQVYAALEKEIKNQQNICMHMN